MERTLCEPPTHVRPSGFFTFYSVGYGMHRIVQSIPSECCDPTGFGEETFEAATKIDITQQRRFVNKPFLGLFLRHIGILRCDGPCWAGLRQTRAAGVRGQEGMGLTSPLLSVRDQFTLPKMSMDQSHLHPRRPPQTHR